jgi:hypothetical protein
LTNAYSVTYAYDRGTPQDPFSTQTISYPTGRAVTRRYDFRARLESVLDDVCVE